MRSMNCRVVLVYQLTVCSEAEENRENLIEMAGRKTVRMCTEYLSADWRLNTRSFFVK
jgi:hypothetical protein